MEGVNVLEPPVTTPSVKSPVVLLALVSLVVFAPSVTAPKMITSFELLIAEARVTVPLVLSVTSPLKVKVSHAALPKLRVPVLAKVTALVTVLLEPVIAKLTTVLGMVNVAAETSPEGVAVPPIDRISSSPTFVILPLTVTSLVVSFDPLEFMGTCASVVRLKS